MKKKLLMNFLPFVAIAFVPVLFRNQSVLYTANMILLYVILGISINMLTGLTGQFSFGHAGLWAVGAYTSAILTATLGLPFIVGFFGGVVAGGFVGLLLAFPCMRVKGSYLALLTWTFAEIVKMILTNWTKVTGGVNGIKDIPAAAIGPLHFNTEGKFFWLALTVAILCHYVYVRVRNSRVGSAFLAIKQDPLAAGVLGINVPRYKLMSFVLCAMIAGASGSLFAHFLRFVSPDSFTLAVSGMTVQVVLVGGFGFPLSPWLGSTLIFGVSEMLRVFGGFREVLIGTAVLAVLIFTPNGLVGIAKDLRHKITVKKTPAATKGEGVL